MRSPDEPGRTKHTSIGVDFPPRLTDDTRLTAAPSTATHRSTIPRPDGLRSATSLLLVNTGNGKGKSSAAFGVMMRGVARGWKVAVLQFIKSGDWKVGEEKRSVASSVSTGKHSATDSPGTRRTSIRTRRSPARVGPRRAPLIESGDHDLVVLDELTYLMNWEWIDADDVISVLRNRPPHVNVDRHRPRRQPTR